MKTMIGLAVLATALMTAPAMAGRGGSPALNVAGISVGAGALTGHNGVVGLLTGHGAVGVNAGVGITTGKSGILGTVLGRGGALGGLLGGGCGCR
ncbi:MAG: hypothetical protein DCC74_09055 [Proteobacteria bacterium]|nr:MAG: hypothetical protein DCC74_09055 [Pseudomonadota bacterium]